MTPDNKKEKLPDNPPEKTNTIRCPRLGHQIDFSYCQCENYGLPCFKTMDCWHTQFNVHAYLKKELSPQDFEKIFIKKGTPKLFSLLDLIEQAKKNNGAED